MKNRTVITFIMAGVMTLGLGLAAYGQNVSASVFNGAWSGAVEINGDTLGSLLSLEGGITFNGSVFRGPSVGGRTATINARIQGRAAPITSDGVVAGSWFYVYSGNAKIGVALYFPDEGAAIFFGAATIAEQGLSPLLSGFSASGIGSTYEGAMTRQ